MTSKPATEAGLGDAYRILFRHKKKAGGFFLAVMLGVCLYAFLGPRTYRSEGKLFVRLGRENARVDPTATLGREPAIVVPYSRESEMNSVVELLQSQVLLESVVDALGPETILHATTQPASKTLKKEGRATTSTGGFGWLASLRASETVGPREQAVLKLAQNLEVEPVKKSSVIRIAYQGKDPRLCRKVIDQVVDDYLARHVRLNRTRGTLAFLDDQTRKIENSLREAEQELRALKDRTGLVAPAEQRRVLVEQVGRIEEAAATTAGQLATTEAAVSALQQKLALLPENQVTLQLEGVEDEGTGQIRAQFYALQLREQELAAKLTDAHPKLQEIRRQTAEAKKILEHQERTGRQITTEPHRQFEKVELALVDEQTRLVSLKAQADKQQIQLAEARRKLKELNNHEFQVVALARAAELREAEYRRYSANLEQARIDEALEAQRMSNITVVQPATLNHKPVRPQKMLVLVLGFMLAFGGGLAVALVAEYLDHSFSTPEDIEHKLDLPTLAAIPRLNRRDLVFNGRKS